MQGTVESLPLDGSVAASEEHQRLRASQVPFIAETAPISSSPELFCSLQQFPWGRGCGPLNGGQSGQQLEHSLPWVCAGHLELRLCSFHPHNPEAQELAPFG